MKLKMLLTNSKNLEKDSFVFYVMLIVKDKYKIKF